MSEIKNKVITISGEPASGKSTIVEKLKEKYENEGYTVTIVTIGHLWREAAIETYKRMKPEVKNPTLDQIHEDPDFANYRKEIDLALDGKVKEKGEQINSKSRPNEVFIFDSRMAWMNIPSAYAIRAVVNEEIAGIRVFNDKKRGKEDQYPSVEAAILATKTRKIEELKRYKERYGVDLSNVDNYDLIVDTSYTKPEEIADIIINGERAYREGKEYQKYWGNPNNSDEGR